MVGRSGSLALALVVVLAFIVPGLSSAQRRPQTIDVHVDSVLATDTNEGVDERLGGAMAHQLRSLFNYTTYRLVNHQDAQAACGKMIAFTLPGGRILHVQPRAVDGDMIAMELVLFQGPRPLMTTDLKLRNRGTLMVGGPRYQQGMLIISIGASTTPNGGVSKPSPGVASRRPERLR
jgi:hypothetical protein